MKHLTLHQFREEHERILQSLSLLDAAQHPNSRQLDIALDMASSASYKIIHPLLIQRYRMPYRNVRTKPLVLIGLDVETNARTGEPMLLGFAHPKQYTYIHKPTLAAFAAAVTEIRSNNRYANLVCWGNLDIQTIIRLFAPTEEERLRIARGISAVVKDRVLITAPIQRSVGIDGVVYISHYISGRSLRLGIISSSRSWTDEIWIFNLSQFYSARIANVAKAFRIPWKDYPFDTHIVDWLQFTANRNYTTQVLESNRQDAQTVGSLAALLQQRFFDVFKAYPSILVSPGSLTDAATGALLSDDDYAACSQKWIIDHVWKAIHSETLIARLETLASESYSAGYIDQFAIGYFPIVHSADIASAYPDKIRSLPDLRYSTLLESTTIAQTAQENTGHIFTAYIHGLVHIPPSLRFHPITLRTYMRENYRPTGDFRAAYTLEEREWCVKHGASFEEEEAVFVLLTERKPAPLALVSQKLGDMRTALLADMKGLDHNAPDYAVFDGQQYLVKQVDNSSYGKTVMTTERVELADGKPAIVGYIAGDRFNQLYGTYITAQTRIQIADVCMRLLASGQRPIMTMTDSVYWEGTADGFPKSLTRPIKTPGFFDPVQTFSDFYLLKTGQYEYRKDAAWTYKLRGIPIDRNTLHGDASVYRKIISEYCADMPPAISAESILIRIPTRRLITIGRHDLDMLGAIVDGITEIAPFRLTSKNVERNLPWQQLLNDHLWLATPHAEATNDATPLALASQLYLDGTQAKIVAKRNTKRNAVYDDYVRKQEYIISMSNQTGKPPPPGRVKMIAWHTLYSWYGVIKGDYRESHPLLESRS